MVFTKRFDIMAEKTSWRTPPQAIDEALITNTYEADVAIIGFGYSGLAAFRTLAEAGKKVIAAESMPREKWWTYGHDFAHINSKWQKEHGFPEVDVVEFVNNFQVQTQNKANAYFTMQFARHSGETFDWFIQPVSEDILNRGRFAFYPENEYTIHRLNNGFRYYGGTMQWWEDWQNGIGMRNNGEGMELKNLSWANRDYMEANFPNAQVLYDTQACQLLKEEGKVMGFVAKQGDEYIRVLAKDGVILAGGGFGANNEMCKDLLPHIARTFASDEKFLGIMDRNGSAIQMGVWAGGRIETDIGSMNFDSSVIPDYIPGPLWVNEEGCRFQNEGFAGPELNGFYHARSSRGKMISVYDSTYDSQILRGFPGHQAFDYSDAHSVETMMENFAEARAQKGTPTRKGFVCADSVEELADAMGLTAEAKDNFLNTIARYNELCKQGVDEDYGKDPRFMNAIAEGPFYAHITEPKLGFALCTVGAFVTTNKQQVVDANYKPIPGLYACGNCCGRRFGTAYITPMPGMSIGMAVTLGRELGKYLAEK